MAVLKLFRNNTLFANRAAALASITTKASTLGDGEVWLASYGTSPNAKSILAIKRTSGVTVFDNEDISDAVSALDAQLANVAKSGSASDVSTTAITATSNNVAVSGTDVPAQILSLATSIKSVSSAALSYTVQKLNSSELAQLSDASNVKEAYKLVSYTPGDNPTYTQVGETIKIYKDAALTSVTTSGTTNTTITFVYSLADGTSQTVSVDLSQAIFESEIGTGLKLTNHVVSVDSATLTVTPPAAGETDSTISGTSNKVAFSDDVATKMTTFVNNRISEEVGKLDANESDTGNFVGVTVVETNGKISSVTVTENDIASASAVLTGVAAGNGISVSTKTNNSQTVSVALDTTTNSNDNALSVGSSGLYLSGSWDCGTY